MVTAGLVLTIAGVALTRIGSGTPVPQLMITFAAFGVGFGLINAPITNSAVSGMPRDRAGAASAVASTSRQIGVSIGVALCGSLTTAGAAAGIGAGFAESTHTIWWAVAVVGIVIAALGVLSASRWGQRTADDVAEMFEPREVANVS